MELPIDFRPPEGVEVFSTESSVNWLHDGILYIYSIPGIEHTIEYAKKNTELFGEKTNYKEVPIICDLRNAIPIGKEVRDYYGSEEGTKYHKSFAFLVGSPFSRVVANFFIGFKKSIMPMKMFTDSEEAILWSKKHIG